MAKPLFIAGTDTDIGKTLIAAGLLKAFELQGVTTCALKPVAAGCSGEPGQLRNTDALLLQKMASVQLPYSQVNPVALAEPCSPHIAANLEDRRLQVARLEGFCRGVLMQSAKVCVIEGAGGWRVPLSERELMSDLAKALNTPVVLVVGMRLGCLNHALLTAEAILRDGLPLVGWVANCVDASMPHLEENIETLKRSIAAPCLGVVPHLEAGVLEEDAVLKVANALQLPALAL